MIVLSMTAEDNSQIKLDAFAGRASNLGPVMELLATYLEEEHRERIYRQESVTGVPWKPLSPKYVASKRKRESLGSDMTLVRDGHMVLEDFVSRWDNNSATVENTAEYAGINDAERPFMGITPAGLAVCHDLISTYLMEAFE